MKSKLGLDEEKTGKSKLWSTKHMKEENNVAQKKCPCCGSTNLEANEDMVKCLDCGMGKYKKGSHKGAR